VDQYSLRSRLGNFKNEYGQIPCIVELDVQWNPKIQEVADARRTLIRSNYSEAEDYHSRAAIGANWLTLAELQRKINRTRDYGDKLLNIIGKMPASRMKQWRELVWWMHEFVLENMSFDHIYIQKYIKEHKTSSVIPRTTLYRGRRWGQLTLEETKHLYELAKAYLEDLVADRDKWNGRVINSEAPGRGLRARPSPVSTVRNNYKFQIDRTRQVNFVPYLSTWFAFVSPSVKEAIYKRISDTFTSITGIKLLYPPMDKGAYWKKIADYLNDGYSILNADGSNWEMSTCVISDQYHCAVDDGIYQLPSGIAFTTNTNSIASCQFFDAHVTDKSGIEAVGVLGDDIVIIGRQDKLSKIEDLPNIWEIDHVATRIKCILGVMILPDYKGTFPGLRRVTIDRADKAIALKVGEEMGNIEGTMGPDAHEVYDEIMAYGTLHGTPFLSAIGEVLTEKFWDDWARDKTEFASNLDSASSQEQQDTSMAEAEALVSL
jgi:hypothetical protein